jgi:hypothetical protein
MASASGSESPPRKRRSKSAGGGQMEMDMMKPPREHLRHTAKRFLAFYKQVRSALAKDFSKHRLFDEAAQTFS